MILRDYQIAAMDLTHARIDEGFKRILIHSGTGTGKTVIASEITKRATALGHGVLFLAHRKELIDQAWNKLRLFGVPAYVMMGDDKRRTKGEKVCVASVPTLVHRTNRPKADLIFVDECHRAPADSYLKILKLYPNAIVLGLTATPCRADSRGLGDVFEIIVPCPSVADMMRRIDPATGKPYLVGTRVFAPPSVDLTGVKVVRGDYKSDDLQAACDKPKLIGNIVAHWTKHTPGQRTVVFAAGVEHSKHIVEEFRAVGVTAEHLDGTTPKEQREAILERLVNGTTRVVSNCQVLTEGWDCPPVSVIILARPTKSVGLYLQMVGRALRPFPGKQYCTVLDHAGSTRIHGFVDDEREWSLDPSDKHNGKSKQSTLVTCKQSVMNCWCGRTADHTPVGDHLACYGTFRPGPKQCPFCGCPIQTKTREIETTDGDLVEMDRNVVRQSKLWDAQPDANGLISLGTPTSRRAAFESILRVARNKGYNSGWAAHVFKGRFKMEVPRDWMPRER